MKIQRVQVVLCLTVFWLQLVGPVSVVTRAQSPTSPIPLSAGKPVEKELKAGETHRYTLDLSAGEFVHLVAEQKAMDVVVIVLDPTGKPVAKVNYLERIHGPEPVFWIAEQAGSYEVQLQSATQTPFPGKYSLELRTRRQATPMDQEWLQALTCMGEAEKLAENGDEASVQSALKKNQAAHQVFQKLNDLWFQAINLYIKASILFNTGDQRAALENYRSSYQLFQQTEDRNARTDTLYKIGETQGHLRQLNEAIQVLKTVIVESQSLQNISREAYTTFSLASVYEDLGNLEFSFENFNRALLLFRKINDLSGEAYALSRLSRVYQGWEQFEIAQSYAERALTIHKQLGEKEGELNDQTILIWLLQAAGKNHEAIKLIEEVLKDQHLKIDPWMEINLKFLAGQTYVNLGDQPNALLSFKDVVKYAQLTHNQSLAGTALHQLGYVHQEFGNYQPALEYYLQAAEILKTIGDLSVVNTYHNIGDIYTFLGQFDKAREYYQKTETIRIAAKQHLTLCITYNQFANLEMKAGNLSKAKRLLELAINSIENLRSQFINPQNRALVLSSSQKSYDMLINFLFQLETNAPTGKHIAEAFLISEKRRARSLIEQLVETKLPPATNVPPELLARRDVLAKTLTDKTEGFLPFSENNPERAKTQQELDVLAKELELVEAEIRKANPAFANLTAPQPLSASQVQAQVLDADTQLVSYQLGDERSFAWVISKDRVDGFVLPKRSEIETAVRTFVNHLTGKQEGGSTPDSVKATARIVSDLIIKPLASHLKAKRLIIIPDGALFYLPFGALPAQLNPNHRHTPSTPDYLIEQFELTFEPSASTLVALRETFKNRTQTDQTAFVLANPVFSPTDDRFKGATKKQPDIKEKSAQLRTYQEERLLSAVGDTWLPIPGTSEQAQVIRQLAGSNRCRVVEGFQASKKLLTQTDLSPFRIVHFATHGRFDSTRPEFSGLVLSLVDEQAHKQPGYFLSQEIYNLKLNADLVVLSACESGLGKELKGEGVIGLTRAFMYAGSPRVIASLWSVSDSSTAELMKRFYQHLLSKTHPLPPAQALQKAQIEMLTGKNPKWRNPFHWAAFQLQGEYR